MDFGIVIWNRWGVGGHGNREIEIEKMETVVERRSVLSSWNWNWKCNTKPPPPPCSVVVSFKTRKTAIATVSVIVINMRCDAMQLTAIFRNIRIV